MKEVKQRRSDKVNEMNDDNIHYDEKVFIQSQKSNIN